jgi:hypothetical protein
MIHDCAKTIIKELNCDVWIETGIHGASSADKIHDWFPDMMQYMVDIDQKCVDFAKNAMYANQNKFTIEQNNSPDFLKRHINDISNYNLPIFFLDAHGWDNSTYWPLRDELNIILDLPKCVIIIDDFKHPSKNFGYDSYTVDNVVIPNDLDNIRDLLKQAKVKSVYHCKESAMNNMGVVFIFKGIVYNNDNFFDEELVN